MSRFNYEWSLKDTIFTKDKGKVFSCFACGGGSTMGYKLAGFDVIGCNEIDPKMNEAYVNNHNPKFNYLEPIQEFKNRKDLPEELYNLDILDGSPPCSSFSMAGNREKDWGKEKKFKEGQAKQVLDTLFFDFIDLAKELQPKIVVAENVKGLLQGEAVKYVAEIYKAFDKGGYIVQHWLLDASKMGVPQKRERVFFIALRKDLCDPFMIQKDLFLRVPELNLKFNNVPIVYSDIKNGLGRIASALYYSRWEKRNCNDKDFGDITLRLNGSGSCFSDVLVHSNQIVPTITGKGGLYDFDSGHFLSRESFLSAGTFPVDYNFCSSKYQYIIGMSVPPVMVANVAYEIFEQWLSRINAET